MNNSLSSLRTASGSRCLCWEDLLRGPLFVYVKYFIEAGYDDFDFLFTLSPSDWEEMIDAVKELQIEMKSPVVMKAGHRVQIMARLRKEKANRDMNERELEQEKLVTSGLLEKNPQDEAKQRHFQHQAHIQKSSYSTSGAVFCEGLGCLRFHWLCYFATFVVLLLMSLLALLIYSKIGQHARTGLNEKNDAWQFVRVLYFLGFGMSGLSFCLCLYAYFRNPDARDCKGDFCSHNGPSFLCGDCGAICAGNCSFGESTLRCPSIGDTCRRGFCERNVDCEALKTFCCNCGSTSRSR